MFSIFVSAALSLLGCNDQSVGRHNAAPDASITSHADGDEVYEGYTVTLRGSASDADNLNTDLTATWFVGGEEACSGAPTSDGITECEVTIDVDDSEVMLEVRDVEGAADSAAVTLVIINTSTPVVEISAPVADGVFYSDQLVEFAGMVTDEEDDVGDLTVWWESSLGDDMTGIDTVPNADGELTGFGYLTEGEHAIELFAEDLAGKVGSDSVVITVGASNSAPECEITVPASNSTGLEGDLIVFEAIVSDVDVPANWLGVAWSSDQDGSMGSSVPNTGGDVAFPWADLTAGTHVVSLTVTDEVGADCSDFIIYTVGSSNPPMLTVSAPLAGDIYDEGETVAFSGTVSDIEDASGDISLEWSSDIDGVISNAAADSSGLAQFTKSDLSVGSHNLSVTATDTDGLYATQLVSFVVNGLPSAPTVSIAPDPAVTGDDLNASASGSVDPEASTVTYSYEWYNGGVLSSASTTATLPNSATSKGESWSVVVTPTDSDGGVGATGTALVVIGNTAPAIATPVITPSTGITTSSTLYCSATATDADGETPTISYEWTNGTSTLGTSSSLTLTSATAAPSDSITCTATATDGSGDTDSGQTSVSVDNSDPVVATVSITPSSGVTTSSTLYCSATATDADGGSPTLSYEWTNGSSTLGTSSSLTLSSSTASPSDTIVCEATATDADGGTDSSTDSVSVDNTAPVVTSVAVTPASSVTTSSTLYCSATATDADGGSPTLSYEWTNGSSTLGSSSSLTLTSSTASPSDTIVCEATATDADGGTDSSTDSVSIDNSDPVVTTVAISPSSGVTTSSTLYCSATATDADGGSPTLSYEWTNGSSTLGSSSSLTLSSSTASPSDTIVCEATATDADGGTDSSTDSVSVDNSDPVVATVSITPSSGVTTSSTLYCSATATDSDGGSPTLSYEWTNGSSTLGSSASLTLSSSTASPSDTIVCEATATDADGGTDSSTDSVSVDNTAPVVTSVAVTPSSSVTTSSTLYCAAAATDSDGGSPTLSYEWTNGSSTLGSSSSLTLSSSTASPSDTIVCEATATDSDGGADSGTDSVTVDNSDPVVTTVAISPSSGVTTSSILACSASATDTDGGSPTLSYEWTNGTSTLGTSAILTLTSSTASPSDTIVCEATATDSDGGTDSSTDSVSVGNSDPVVATVSITPSSGVTTSSTLTCSATATDADGGSPTITYAWTNGSSTLGSSSSLTLSSSTASPSDTVVCEATATDADGGTDSGTSSVNVDNTAPVVTSVAVTPASGVTVLSTLYCAASATDADGGSPTLSYIWTNGSSSIGSGVSVTLTNATASPSDTITCTATATDADGDTDSSTDSVTVDNSAPSISGVTVTPLSPVVSDTLTCAYSGFSDADGDTDQSTYSWSDGNSTLGSSATLAGLFVAGDSVTCTVTPYDGTDTGTTASASVTIQNSAPTISLSSPTSGDLIHEDESVTFTATVADVDQSESSLSIEWSSDVDGIFSTQSADSTGAVSFTQAGLTVGAHNLTVTVTDSGGLTATDTTSFTVNGLPSQPNVSIAPSTAYVGDNLVASASGSSDAEGSTITYAYAWYNGGVLSSSQTAATLPSSATAAGDSWEVVVTPTDADGGTGPTGSDSITVSNTAPVISGPTVSPSSSVTTSSTLSCSATATDADGETPTITYEWTNGTSTLGTSSSLTLTSSTASPSDTIACTATATDGSGATDSASASVSVGNTDPVISSAAITPTTGVKVTSTLTCTATATDADGGSPIITYAWTNGSTSIGSVASVTLTASMASTGDTITCTATATDADGGTDTSLDTATVTNSAPVLSSATLTPTSATEASTLTCTPVGATDADGDTVSYSYAWNISGIASSQTSSTLSGAYFNRDDSIYCVVTPVDGSDAGSSVSSNSISVSNTAPSVSSVSITPTTALDNDTLTCSYSFFDADNDTDASAIAWTVGTTTIGTGTTVSTGFVAGDTVKCTVTANDGTDTGTAASTTALIGASNTAPVISAVTISPSTIYTNDTISSSVTATDADGDTISYTYAWYVANALVAETSSAIDCTTYCDKGQSVYVVATPSDGTDTGTAAASSSVTVLNTAPTAPSIAIDPTAPEAGTDDLICLINTASTDDDGDTITYTISWTSDYVAWTGSTHTTYETDDTLSGTDIEAGVRYECVVSASDGSVSTINVKDDVTPTGPTHPGGGVMVLISAGTFDMGCTATQVATGSCDAGESPEHEVTLTHDFYIGETEVTQGEYVSVIGSNPSYFTSCGSDCPVENLSWHKMAEYANALSVFEGLSECFSCSNGTCSTSDNPYYCDGYRLPTEAEWEYAARAGTDDYVYAGSNVAPDLAWYLSNSGNGTNPVAQKDPNDWGLYDMSGNVWEWVWDWYDSTYYSSVALSDPQGSATGSARARRGGDWGSAVGHLRVSTRFGHDPAVGFDHVGFRLARTASSLPITHPGGGQMIYITAGTFDMGCTTAQQADGNCGADESPVHSVTLTHDFYMGETEVTQGEYKAVMGTNPSYWSNCGSTCPVEYITWYQMAEYANALSVLDGLTECFTCTSGSCTTPNSPYTCDGYRLPTEAEWEYAARAGTDYVYSGSNTAGDVGWYSSNASLNSYPVAQKLPNDWGLYDMSGNVWEWTWDWYDSGYYSSSPSSDPEGHISGSNRAVRGGNYSNQAQNLRVSYRNVKTPTNRYNGVGLRLTRTAIP